MTVSPEKKAMGETHGSAKLSAPIVVEIRSRYANERISFEKLSKEYPVCSATLRDIVRRKIWRHVP